MQNQNIQISKGWSLKRSIVLELDVVLAIIAGCFFSSGMSSELMEMVRSLPKDWRDDFAFLLGEDAHFFNCLYPLASLAGVTEEEDYGPATLTIRELTISEALDNLTERAKGLGISLYTELPPAERLASLMVDEAIAVYSSFGMELFPDGIRVNRMRSDIRNGADFLKGGKLYARFWQWMDRFYYEFYRPWRLTRIKKMDQMHNRAAAALGSDENFNTAPHLSWLPPQNPLLRIPELKTPVKEGKLHVIFWEEPFGLSDAHAIRQGRIITSFAEPGELYRNFLTASENIAERIKALDDPTRLLILRLIRNFGMINTEIAAYLDLARPTVSVHAKILRQAGLITSQQEGREVRHKVNTREVRRLFKDLERFLDITDE